MGVWASPRTTSHNGRPILITITSIQCIRSVAYGSTFVGNNRQRSVVVKAAHASNCSVHLQCCNGIRAMQFGEVLITSLEGEGSNDARKAKKSFSSPKPIRGGFRAEF